MITIEVLGLDEYVVGHYSKDHSKNLAQLFEASEDDILFFAPNGFVLHGGTEQTSWNTIIRVKAPEKYEVLEDKIADYIIKTLKEFSINVSVEFTYYHSHHRHDYVNKEYPRFINDNNVVSVEPDELGEGEELYEGNIFEGFEDKLEEAHDCKCGHKH